MAQLRMKRPNLENLPPVEPPEGYGIRHYQPGDEIHWGNIINASFGGRRTEEDVRREIIERPVFTPEGLFFATYQGQPVGTACSWKRSPKEKITGYVHMVGVMPEHQGNGLGYLVSLATLHFFREHGFQEAMLDTDDQRVPALITYLRLGFEPVLRDDSQRHRWALIFSKFLKSAPQDIHPAIRRYFTQLQLIDDLSIENYQTFFETVCNLSLEDYRQIGVAGNPAPSELRRLDNDLEEIIEAIPIREPLDIMLKEYIDQYLAFVLNANKELRPKRRGEISKPQDEVAEVARIPICGSRKTSFFLRKDEVLRCFLRKDEVLRCFLHIYLFSKEDFSSRKPYELLQTYCQQNNLPMLKCKGEDLGKSIAISDIERTVLFLQDLRGREIGTELAQRKNVLLIVRGDNPESDISEVRESFQVVDIDTEYPFSQERIYQLLKSYLKAIRIRWETPIAETHLRKISHETTSPGAALNHLGICLAFSAYRQKMGASPQFYEVKRRGAQITDDDLECCCNRRVISWIDY